MAKCAQQKCEAEANTRVFWPGRVPMATCLGCAAKAQKVGDAIGLYVGIEEIREPEIGPCTVPGCGQMALREGGNCVRHKHEWVRDGEEECP